ncbi:MULTISPECIES: sugar phosphate isomerase/epimerase family protein [Metabacillus]|uniref:Xylose isomerase n=2 Tax=Metabacillus TaxID=2675233 RepID=A0A179SN16_9BACI|nr:MULTISPECIES: TIM barrel protein [Metabacillus]OAS82764.1 xylose isomerase [Metabacillus litoralis]QNF30205.1 sugar phosphate isomerase/epimerase [Metabacillus sp. KUDC1714]
MKKINNGSSAPPRLDIQQSWWAMNGIGNGVREWITEEKVEKIAEAGFTGINGFLPPQEKQEEWHNLLEKYQLSFSICAYPWNREELSTLLKQAQDFGVQHVNSQVMDSFVIGEEAVQLLKELTEEAERFGTTHFVETHRGRITQDLLRTVDYVKAIPNLSLTIDFSHYVVSGEMVGDIFRAEPFFNELLQRCGCIHGRVSNGEQVQVDIGPNGEHPMLNRFKGWWKQGMENWLMDAKVGDIFPFVCELGPPGYAITKNSYSKGNMEEISDRWEQSLLLKRIAEEQWAECVQGLAE